MKLYLNLGAGGHKLPGFVNVDIDPGADVQHDLTRDLPWNDDSVDGIYSEHFIEHIAQKDGLQLLRECRRVLIPGGRLRIATPDLDAIVDDYARNHVHGDWQKYGLDWTDNRCERLNMALRWWGHQWVYNEEELARLADMAGLTLLGRCAHGVSDDPAFNGLEHRESSRLILEFEKPRGTLVGDETPLVSITIPAYNPKYFAAALDSALAQTYPAIEIVICDDCPDDRIERHVAALAAPRFPVRYYRNEKRLFGRNNMIKCLNLADGEFIKFLNDDDVLHPDCVARMIECFRAHPSVRLVTSYRRRIDEHGQELPDIVATTPPVAGDALIEGLSLANALVASGRNFVGEPTTVLFRKRDVARCKPDFMSFDNFPVRAINDMATWINLLLKGDAVYLAEAMSQFRIHPEQAQKTITDIADRFEEGIKRIRAGWQRLGLERGTPGILQIRRLDDRTRVGWTDCDVRAQYGIRVPADRQSEDLAAYKTAVELVKSGAMAQGIAILERLAEQQSPVWQVHSDLGLWHFNNGRHDQAIECLHRAVELEGKISVPVNNLISVLSTLLLQSSPESGEPA